MKRIKARRTWACRLLGETTIHRTVDEANRHLHSIPLYLRTKRDRIYPIATIDMSDEAALVEAAAKAATLYQYECTHGRQWNSYEAARAVLEALGVVRKKKSPRKPKTKKVSTLTMHDIRASYEY